MLSKGSYLGLWTVLQVPLATSSSDSVFLEAGFPPTHCAMQPEVVGWSHKNPKCISKKEQREKMGAWSRWWEWQVIPCPSKRSAPRLFTGACHRSISTSPEELRGTVAGGTQTPSPSKSWKTLSQAPHRAALGQPSAPLFKDKTHQVNRRGTERILLQRDLGYLIRCRRRAFWDCTKFMFFYGRNQREGKEYI